MQHLSELLNIEDSKLAWVLRLGLCGLRSQLQEALKQTTTDPGSTMCQELLQELDEILQSKIREVGDKGKEGDAVTRDRGDAEKEGDAGNIFDKLSASSEPQNPSWEDVFEPVLEPVLSEVTGELQLKDISEALLADKELSPYIGEYQFHSSNDADLWNEMQRLLLRVPEKFAHLRRERILTEATQLGACEDKTSLRQLAFNRNEYIYSGLKGNIRANGLCLSDKINFDPRLTLHTRGTELDILAGIVTICLKFIEIDTSLHHTLKSVDRFGVRSLSLESERLKYITALIDRFHRVLGTVNADPITALRAKLDLDEAIHSLVYLPTCDRFSWWGKLQQEARRTLDGAVEKARESGYQVQIRPLWGIYADVYAFSKDDLQLDIGGVPGEVSACLRVYAKISDEILPGRVLFRSS
ncbi:hypothetical protein QUB80_05385 [Chlorogloeopsis sp. ULAP01]|uniref:hypothetical protein n=1 Tax=Chlorogloeopsis sp. ULAP01 TaxID=3056483 RepID=UPI0025AA461D|nr:hypothetical protein [Chlorogloeopsis sp. ULAP01]MDM9380131.1 hypothetical protein [Chlorogloeopsis sp. ULAP01]